MALVWLETFESYTGTLAAPWTGLSNTAISTTTFKNGVKSLGMGSGGNAASATRAFGSNLSSLTLDFWFWLASAGGQTNDLLRFSDITGRTGTTGMALKFPATGILTVSNDNNFGATLFTTTAITRDTWHSMQLVCVCDATAGSVTLKVDGASVGSFTGNTTGTNGGSSNYYNSIVLTAQTIGGSNIEFFVDDFQVSSGVPAGPGMPKTLNFGERIAFPSPMLVAALAPLALGRAIRRNRPTTRRGLLRFK